MLAPAFSNPASHEWPELVTRAALDTVPVWTRAFSSQRKDHRYYEIVEDTLHPEIEHFYFVARDEHGYPLAVQPYFFVEVDLLEGASAGLRRAAQWLRGFWPRFLRLRTLMVGCVAGEGHLAADGGAQTSLVQQLAAVLPLEARKHGAHLIVWKEFPARYREAMRELPRLGYARFPSLPMTTLNIAYDEFNTYMAEALGRVTRKSLRRTFRKTEQMAHIELSVVADARPFLAEVYPLYEQVYNRSSQHFEKLTPAYIASLSERMPDKVRFFIWRIDGRAVAFSICMLDGDSIFDEYLGLDYGVALKLHLYHYTFRDIVSWAMAHGYKRYRSSGLNYDAKLHWRSTLDPLDLYVRHRSALPNALMRLVLPWLSPVHHDKTLKRFANYNQLWDNP